jgi:hypothetical protein
MGHLHWRKSSFSSQTSCVEMAPNGELVAVRNSNHPDTGTLWLTGVQLADLLAGVKAGEVDDLT